MRDHFDEWMLGGEILEQLGRAVVTAVIHDHELDRIGQRQHRFARQPYELGEVIGFILGGHEHADVGRRRVGGETHSRLRIRAGRMPS